MTPQVRDAALGSTALSVILHRSSVNDQCWWAELLAHCDCPAASVSEASTISWLQGPDGADIMLIVPRGLSM